MSRWGEFASLFNCRDLGGLTTTTGRPVRTGRLFRTDTLSNLDDGDRERFAALGVHTVIDLRRSEEIESQGRAPEWSCQSWHQITLTESPWPTSGCDSEDDVAGYLADRYLEMTEYGAADLVQAITLLARPETSPAVVHCAGGRDRTGVVIALVLSLLGVSEADIAEDYGFSADFTRRWLEWATETRGETPVLPPNILYTPAEAMRLFLTRLTGQHGGVEEYLLVSGLDPAVPRLLREKYLG
jgi:protein-tyrosine phosphatase